MATLLFHIPNKPNIGSRQHQLLPDPLQKVLHGIGWGCLMNSAGPTSTGGTLLTPQTIGKQATCRYAPEEQTWIDVFDKEKNVIYSVGFWNEEPPTPLDLQKEKSFPGHVIQANGQSWMIPVLHPRWTTLPKSFVMTADGMTMEIRKEYRELCGKAEEIRASFTFENAEFIEWNTLAQFAVEVLQLNYRIGLWEATTLLDLIPTPVVSEIVAIAIGFRDAAAEIEAQKKSDTPTNG